MAYADEPKYFAVPDPDTGDMTYWFRDKRGKLQPWPQKPRPARYGPILWKKPGAGHTHVTPEGMKGEERNAWVINWFDTVQRPWKARIEAAIASDPEAAQARFAQFASRCCVCGKGLTDATSKVYGIGPECRAGWPPEILEELARQMGRIHTEWLASKAA